MNELSLVGLADDDNRLVMVDQDGTRFTLPVDDRLTAAVTRNVERRAAVPTDLGPLQGPPSPREIQNRIRHGASVASIAANAGVSEESVERFAHQVIAERSYIATQAKTTTVQLGATKVELAAAVVNRLRGTGVDVDSMEWDAWRRTNGTWSVVVSFTAGPNSRSVTFSYDAASKRVGPADDESRSILDTPPMSAIPMPVAVSTNPAPATRNHLWDQAHPAARAQLRRASTESSHPSATPPPDSGPPHWEGLLFGTPRDNEGDH